MTKVVPPLPDTDTLTRILQSLESRDATMASLSIIERRPNLYASSAPSEIVTCRLDRDVELRLLCKYDAGPEGAVGHRGGTAREALVYRHLIGPMGQRPRFFGSHTVPETGETWLFIEFLGEPLRVSRGPQPHSMRLGAHWIGQFHRTLEGRVDDADLAFLPRYDVDYYVSWADRASRLAGSLHDEFPWLATACRRGRELLSVLAGGGQTVLHGEYYSANVLLVSSRACPIDWESAAVGAGEIDVASLTQGWGIDLQRQVEREYCAVRWPDGLCAEFDLRLGAARLYWCFRWLVFHGERVLEPASRGSLSGLFDELLVVSRRAGCID